jgi:hypothetical protein
MMAIVAIAAFWAVSVGLSYCDKDEEKWTEKKKRRSKKSLLQRGLRAMNGIFVGTCFVH